MDPMWARRRRPRAAGNRERVPRLMSVSDQTQTAVDELDPDEIEVEDTDPDEEEHLDPEAAARRAAALAHVRKFGDPALRSKARPVERFDEALREEVQRMGQLMTDAIGVGLAATQLG